MTRALILGAGVSGQAAADLADRLGISTVIYDESPQSTVTAVGRSVATGAWDPTLLDGMELVIASPGFSERSGPIVDALEAGIEVWSEIEFASRHESGPIAAITGTNGKTTVTEAASAMLQASGLVAPAVGNIGSPMSAEVGGQVDCLVVEVSSFQLRFTDRFHPRAAAITNVAVDHLDWHGSEFAYRQAKKRIYANQTKDDLLVFDADDPGATQLASAATSRLLPVSGHRVPADGAGVAGGKLTVGDASVEITDLASTDSTLLVNLAIAAGVALEMGASPEGVLDAARSFRRGSHRRELILEADEVRWVNDSKATNPHAAAASIDSNQPVVLIAGGQSKGLDVGVLADHPGVRILLGIGESGPDLVERAGAKGRLAENLETAVEMARELARPGETVLLAPGCASFDQFDSYAERGARFKELVMGVRR
ncbi:MAG: UDP-N-acetylmuramoyl-L-alanine--D-glutamate ligase [Acidimicrobiia bacterium]|nr:UDP-N-acetylmuramoyl-L-alanine--D-glutamate ligase [Acidimicrobiia bacterium]